MSSFDYLSGQAYFRDAFVPFKDANVSIASSPVLYGLSVYTVFSVQWKGMDVVEPMVRGGHRHDPRNRPQ